MQQAFEQIKSRVQFPAMESPVMDQSLIVLDVVCAHDKMLDLLPKKL